MKYTTNYSLNMPESTEYYNVTHFNENAEEIDSALKGLSDAVDNLDSGVSDEATARAEADTALQDTVSELKSEVEEGYLPLSGGTLTGALGIGSNNEGKIYADSSGYVKAELQEGIKFDNDVILSEDPTGDMQAATKQYVDNLITADSNSLYLGGLLIQWGTYTANSDSAAYSASFPVSYDSTDDITNVQLTLTGASTTGNPFGIDDFPIYNISKSILNIGGTAYNTGTKVNGSTGTRSGNEVLHWLVVGNAPSTSEE